MSRSKEAFDKQLDALLIQLKSAVRVGTPFRASQERACFYCGCRLLMYYHEKKYCLKCDDIPTGNDIARKRIADILKAYPEREGVDEEKKKISEDDRKYGQKLKNARVAKGLSTRALAGMIENDRGGKMTHSSIVNFEAGRLRPSESVRQQLGQVLEVKYPMSKGHGEERKDF